MKILISLLLSCVALQAQFSVITTTNGALTGTRGTNLFNANAALMKAAISANGLSNVNVQALVATNPVFYGPVTVGENAGGVPPQITLGNYWTIAANNSSGELWIENVDNGDIPVRLFNSTSGTTFTLPVTVSNTVTATHGITASNFTAQTGLAATNSAHYGTNNWSGDISLTPHTYTSLVNGDNSNIELGTNALALLSGGTTAVNIHSFGNKREGIRVLVRFSGGTSHVIYNESGTEGTATRRIVTGTGGNLTLTNAPAWADMYQGATRWYVISHSR